MCKKLPPQKHNVFQLRLFLNIKSNVYQLFFYRKNSFLNIQVWFYFHFGQHTVQCDVFFRASTFLAELLYKIPLNAVYNCNNIGFFNPSFSNLIYTSCIMLAGDGRMRKSFIAQISRLVFFLFHIFENNITLGFLLYYFGNNNDTITTITSSLL